MDRTDTPPSYASPDYPHLLTLLTGEYEVFLSFRGPDTRHQITDIIYRFLVHLKIRTFRDDDALRKGEGIWPNLVRAIGQSKIYIPIFSESYAHSKWCLLELAEMVERRRQDGRHIILPIFYMVDPGDVRRQTGPYRDAFEQHERKFDQRTIQIWKEALCEVGTLNGWHVKNNDEQGAIADLVSNVVWSHLSKSDDTLLNITDELVGIDDHVKAVVDNLSIDSNEGIVMVGIHGVGGVGKTTLATAVYNKISARFDRCCFLENIRETQQLKDGNLNLQKKLISDILRMDSVESIADAKTARNLISSRVSEFKILVVLDDVGDAFKFEDILGNPKNFFSGCRFIATSRNTSVLRSLHQEQCKLYAVDVMGFDRSLQLFCKHAFKKDSPPPSDFDTLSRDILSTTGGLPLMLKVVGQLLYKQEVAVWEEKLAQLKETPENEVMERLMISYNALAYEAQQIFLDIACFFIGTDKDIASYMWADCKFRPITNINILIQRSMIKIDEDGQFQMHDQLRDMGREIVRRENVEVPWMRSRTWSNDINYELLYGKGTSIVKGIKLTCYTGHPWFYPILKNDSFTNLSELRYFDAPYVELAGDFNNLLPNLRWLALSKHEQYYQFPYGVTIFKSHHLINLSMRNLVILDLNGSPVLKDKWDVLRHIKPNYMLCRRRTS
ncbi:Disease resistance protein L6 [Linum grandiflorum]